MTSRADSVIALWCPCWPGTSRKVGQMTSGRSVLTISTNRASVRSGPHRARVSVPLFENPKSTIGSSGLSDSQYILMPRISQALSISAVLSAPRSPESSLPMSFCPPSPRFAHAKDRLNPSRMPSAASIADVSSSGWAPVFMKRTTDVSGLRAHQSSMTRGRARSSSIRIWSVVGITFALVP